MIVRPPADLTNQFVIGVGLPSPGDEFRSISLGKMTLWHHGRLKTYPVFDAAGHRVGYLLGVPIDYENGVIINSEFRARAQVGSDVDRFVEAEVYRLSGSFIFLLDHGGKLRLYLDPDGTLSAVYDASQGVAGATAGILLTDEAYRERFDRDLYQTLRVRRDGWFPGGLTAHFGVSRVLVNHFLDLTNFEQTRHWPSSSIEVSPNPEANVAAIAENVRRTIDVLRRSGDLSLTLTAGNETRFILAACRDFARELDFVTVDGKYSKLDVHTAKVLAATFGLQHRLLPSVRATEAEAEDWHARTGHCMGGDNMHLHPTIRPLREKDYFSGGLGGEVGRGFFWKDQDSANAVVTLQSVINRLGMPTHPKMEHAIDAWLRSVAGLDVFLVRDLAYLELRMGCWAFAQSYCGPRVQDVHPIISRRNFELMLSLPPDWRRKNLLILKGIKAAWPELLEFPINAYGDARDLFRLIDKAIRRPYLILKKVRKARG